MNQPGPRREVQSRPPVEIAANAAFDPSTLDGTIDELLRDLRGSPTDLAKFVTRVHQRHCSVLAISEKAIERWNRDDPDSWKRVREWLTMRGVRIVGS